ncbi:hypothetical protein [Clostridium folliculivorans]|uniref:Uncharacterized protein n=1 Tax=Clostridium folliculivorans TaxID=2886038 RepID=A0A9W5Y2I8_9CLOT|nr:hypothetical protein [Clostridium folliculivorans]GKU25372.1 hypothetical protein CFOLD11_21980 [Clostridium folliculivorans]GKU28393.1 hypothetical protein CFB3_04990 [Clostridium folliculivorans]
MKKRGVIGLLVIIILILTILLGMKLFKSNSVVIYKTDIIADDLRINNLTLVSFEDKLYVQDGFVLKLTREENKVDSMYIEIQVAGKRVFDLSGSDDFRKSNESVIYAFNVVDDVKISKDSKMTVKIKYTIGGKEKEYKDEIKMSSIIKFDEKNPNAVRK